jgi:signal transduction histidine kinase
MEERITLMGGLLKIESTSGKGTIVRAEIPLEKPDDCSEPGCSSGASAKTD